MNKQIIREVVPGSIAEEMDIVPGDVLVALSTSGNSANCVAAAEVVKAAGGKAVAFTGRRESRLSAVCDVTGQQACQCGAEKTFVNYKLP